MPLVDINTLWKCETCYFDHYGKCTNKFGCDHGEGYRPAYSKLKVVEAEIVNTAQWIAGRACNHVPHRIKNPEKWVIYHCSECGHSNGRRRSNYCPNCGKPMNIE